MVVLLGCFQLQIVQAAIMFWLSNLDMCLLVSVHAEY